MLGVSRRADAGLETTYTMSRLVVLAEHRRCAAFCGHGHRRAGQCRQTAAADRMS